MADNLTQKRDRNSDFVDKRKSFTDQRGESLSAFNADDIFNSFSFDGYQDIYRFGGERQTYQSDKEAVFNQSNVEIKDSNGYNLGTGHKDSLENAGIVKLAASSTQDRQRDQSDPFHQYQDARQTDPFHQNYNNSGSSSVYKGRYEFDYDKNYRADARYADFIEQGDKEGFDSADIVDERGFVISSNTASARFDHSQSRWDYSFGKKDYDNPLASYTQNSLEEYSTLGYGSFFRTYMGADKKYHTEIRLFDAKDRTDRQRFIGKTAAFVNHTKKTFDLVKPESEEAEASNVDKKLFVGASIAKDVFSDRAYRYRDIEKGLKKEERQLRREIQSEQTGSYSHSGSSQYQADKVDLYKHRGDWSDSIGYSVQASTDFSGSNYQFNDYGGNFKDDGYDKFIQRGYNAQGEYYFSSALPQHDLDDDMLLPSRMNHNITRAEEQNIRRFMAKRRLDEIKSLDKDRRDLNRRSMFMWKNAVNDYAPDFTKVSATGDFASGKYGNNVDLKTGKYNTQFGQSYDIRNDAFLVGGVSGAVGNSLFDIDKKEDFSEFDFFEESINKDRKGNSKSIFNHEDSINKEKLKIQEAKRKEAAKQKRINQRKSAVLASVRTMLDTKRQMQNSLADVSGKNLSGDLMQDGKAGLLQSIIDAAKRFISDTVKAALRQLLLWIGSLLGPILIPILIGLVFVILVIGIFCMVWGAGADHEEVQSGSSYDMSEEEIDAIIDMLWITYGPRMTYERELLIRWGLSKVGCEYNQDKHWSLTEDIYDCSSYTYRAYREALGIDVSHIGQYTAAYIGLQIDDPIVVDEKNKSVHLGYNYVVPDGDEYLPGDIICYGNSSNGRYKGIYHVAVYVGNGMMMEARGRAYGVVYSELRTNNVVVVGRYL